jgi:hypothetical protein
MHNSDLEIIISHEWGMINFDKETIKCHRCRLYITSFDVQQRGRYAGGSNTMVNVSMFLPCQQCNKISEKGRSGSKKWFPKSVAQRKKKTHHNLMCLKSWNFHKNLRWQKITFFITESDILQSWKEPLDFTQLVLATAKTASSMTPKVNLPSNLIGTCI